MTKRTLTVYGILFLCPFAFGLSFTMASSAQASISCCTVYCSHPYEWHPSYVGHFIGGVCIIDHIVLSCDLAYVCPEY